MASSSHRGAAAPYRSREGLSTRSGTNTDEIQLRIDPMHSDLDDHISGLHSQVRMLRNVAQEIESEAKYQNDVIAQLQMMLIKAQAGVKNNARKLNKGFLKYITSSAKGHLKNLHKAVKKKWWQLIQGKNNFPWFKSREAKLPSS